MIHALHGFLGLPRDWDLFESAVQDHRGRPVRLVKHNLWEELAALDDKSLRSWAREFNSNIEGKNILVGYSMGGRLAMHALIDDHTKWSGAVFISAHPGLAT